MKLTRGTNAPIVARRKRERARKSVLGRVKSLSLYAVCVMFAVLHAASLSLLSPDGSLSSGAIDWTLVVVPALATVVLLPSSIRHWRRWVTFIAVLFVSDIQWTLYVLVVGESWVLHKEWVKDRAPGELSRLIPASFRDGFTRAKEARQKSETKSAAAAGDGRKNSAKTPAGPSAGPKRPSQTGKKGPTAKSPQNRKSTANTAA